MKSVQKVNKHINRLGVSADDMRAAAERKGGAAKNQKSMVEKDKVYMATGDILKSIFKEKKTNGKAIAKATGISYSTMRRYQCGGGAIPTYNLELIAKALNVPTDYILGLSESKSKNPDIRYIADKYGLSEEALRRLAMFREREAEISKFPPAMRSMADKVNQPLRVLNAILESGDVRLLEAIHDILFSPSEPGDFVGERRSVDELGVETITHEEYHFDAVRMQGLKLFALGDYIKDLGGRLPPVELPPPWKKTNAFTAQELRDMIDNRDGLISIQDAEAMLKAARKGKQKINRAPKKPGKSESTSTHNKEANNGQCPTP